MRHPLRWVVGFAAVALLATGCGQQSGSGRAAEAGTSSAHEHSAGHEHSPGMSMSGEDHHSDDPEPSEAARMICTDETVDSVVKTFALEKSPESSDSWKDLVYTCTYDLPQGELVLSVKDSPDLESGQAYYDRLAARTAHAKPLKGLDALGLPAFETRHGEVAFLKDGKTLLVDASRLTNAPGGSATDEAYQVATTVVACWSE